MEHTLISLSFKKILIEGEEYNISKVYHHQRDVSYYVEWKGTTTPMASMLPGGSLYLGVTIDEVIATLKQKKLLKIVDKVREKADNQSVEPLSRWQIFKQKYRTWRGFRDLPKV